MRISKLYMPAVTLAGALALAGCGGGGGTTGPTGVACDDGSRAASEEACAQIEAAAALVKTANDAVDAVIEAANGLDVTADTAEADVTAAEGALETAETAIAALPAGDEKTDLTDDIASSKKLIELARQYLDADDANDTEKTELEGEIEDLQEDLAGEKTAKENAEEEAETRKIAGDLETETSKLVTLSGDEDTKGSALKKATDHDADAGKVSKAQGVSSAIAASAQGVLDARKELVDAVAELKQMRASAQTRADGLEDGETKTLLTDQIAATDEAIKAGEALLDARGRNSLQGLVAKYTGEGNTPAEKADSVAKRLNDGARFTITDGITATARPLVFDTISATTADGARDQLGESENAFASGSTRDEASMLKFSEIFEGDTKDIAIDTDVRAAVSLEGFDRDDFAAAPDFSSDDATPASTYLGIPGSLYCRADACEDDGEGWYFAPTNKDAYFAPDGEGGYEAAEFVEWGMWLTEANNGDITVNRYVGTGIGSATVTPSPAAALTTVANAENGLAATATYKGAAAGLSTRETGTGDDKKTASGHFTAEVSLTAKFQATPELTGTINGFEPVAGQGDGHVNRNWSLKLAKVTSGFDDGTVETGDYDSASITGGWTAQAYGGSDTSGSEARPDGIFGGFNADFSDGKASGVYHAD